MKYSHYNHIYSSCLRDATPTYPLLSLVLSFTFPYSACRATYTITVWLEILAGRYFGGLLKICHLAEFTLAVESVLAT